MTSSPTMPNGGTPRAILGTMTIGGTLHGGGISDADATEMIIDFCTSSKWSNIVRDDPMLDTALQYQDGQTEVVLGNILTNNKKNHDGDNNNDFPPGQLSVATKANPFTPNTNLSPKGVREQLESSLKSLQTTSVDIFYLHAPDASNDIEPTLEEVQKMYMEKKFQKFALSNFTAWETVYIHQYMKSRLGYVLPTIYQGMYNAITRQVETELIPALRKLNMKIYVYNPLAGGMLSGKYHKTAHGFESDKAHGDTDVVVGRRFLGTNIWAKRYRERYQNGEQFDAIEVIRKAIEDDNKISGNNISMADASLRWLVHHSNLEPDDGIIIGANSLSHYHDNMKSLIGPPLSDNIIKAFDKANKLCEPICPNYSRGYSGSNLVTKKK